MFLYLFLLFTVVPVVELYLLIQLGSIIGGLETVGVVLVTGIVGAYLARSQGQQVLRNIETNLQKGTMPPEALVHAFLILFGGVLLITPGIITDFLGFMMIIPGSRSFFVLLVKRMFKNGVNLGKIKFHTYSGGSFHQEGWVDPQQPARKVNKEPAQVIDINSYKSE